MRPKLSRKNRPLEKQFRCLLDLKANQKELCSITNKGIEALKVSLQSWQNFAVTAEDGVEFAYFSEPKKSENFNESYRRQGAELYNHLKNLNATSVFISGGTEESQCALSYGLMLTAYEFKTYKSDSKDVKYGLDSITLSSSVVSKEKALELDALTKAIYFSRDLVNEPANVLTATEMAKRFTKLQEESSVKVEVLKKTKIQSLKMGGLLSVNKGSLEEPTFSILEHRHKKAWNKKPIVLVGKGIVYDTGGLSLKPTPNSMDSMKCDMGGAAAVAGAIYAASLADLPVNVVGLIPATDNQPGPGAYQPGDVIKMMNNMHVEVMNTDAEGRIVMADALSYGERYEPILAIDVATLTGSAVRALGPFAAATMGTAKRNIMEQLLQAGQNSWERLVEFPVWDDYESELKSEIADTKNLGASGFGDVMIAGLFLKKFTSAPWIHIDIAGPAFLKSSRYYLPQGGTGFGTALLFEFLKNFRNE